MSTLNGGPGNIVTNGLVLYLDAANYLSYTSGSTVWRDLSSSNLSGSLINGPTFSSGNAGSIVFDGVDDYVDLGTFNGLGSIDRTISVWFRVNSLTGGTTRIITFPVDNTSTDTPAYTVGLSLFGNLEVGIGGTPYDGYILNVSYTLGSWVNITSTIVGKTITIYKNTVSQGSRTSTGVVPTNPLGYLGRYNGNYGQYLPGNIANAQIYNRALTPSEILQNYNAQKSRFGL